MKKLAIYCYFDQEGKVGSYNIYYIKALQQIANQVVVVVNGQIQDTAKELIESLGVEVKIRSNVGFDFGAWKYIFLSLENEKLDELDEIVFCNNSCYGPIYEFSKLWEKMQYSQCDFWGLYEHPKTEKIEKHIQSYFLVIKKKVFISESFKNYIKNLNSAKNWKDAVHQEINFTYDLEQMGFIGDALIKSCPYIDDPTCLLPEYLLNKGFPFIKRKVFTQPYSDLLIATFGFGGAKAITWLQNHSNYPIETIIEDLNQKMPASEVTQVLQLIYSVPCFSKKITAIERKEKKIALILFSFYEDLIGFNLDYIKNLPDGTTIVVVMVEAKLREKWGRYLDKNNDILKKFKFDFRLQPNRGRNESAYWVTCKDIILNFDYICCLHDKKSPQASQRVVGYEWYRHCCDHLLGSAEAIDSILNLFSENAWIGMIVPIEPLFEHVVETVIANPWAGNLIEGQKLYRMLKINAPFDEQPRAPWGGMFWVRGKAMAALYRIEWHYDDFPQEPLPANGTLLHALERMYPTVVQESGYTTAQVSLNKEIGYYYNNLFYTTQNFVRSNGLKIALETSESKNHFSYVKKKAKNALFSLFRRDFVMKFSEFIAVFIKYIRYRVCRHK